MLLTPLPVRDAREMDTLTRRLESQSGTTVPRVLIANDGTLVPLDKPRPTGLLPGMQRSVYQLFSSFVKIRHARQKRDFVKRHAKIMAVVPTFEREDEVDRTVESLLMQTREIDQIVVIINGPGESEKAFESLRWLAIEFPGKLLVERPASLNGRNDDGTSKGSKVGALNYAYTRYLHEPAAAFDFMLGCDADVVFEPDAVHHLEVDLLHRAKAAGVMGRYSFVLDKDLKGTAKSLVMDQRIEFAFTGVRQQLRGHVSEILGGQGTLFRVDALRHAARETDGGKPWDPTTLVEDAKLTQTLQSLGYINATSANARIWTGAMITPHAHHKQRIKWSTGKWSDMTRDFNPSRDVKRWTEQLGLGWNLILRTLFIMTVTTSLVLDMFVFHPLWLIPMGLAVLQNFLVSLKVPGRTLQEIVRSLLFIPSERYFLRAQSVWLETVMTVMANVQKDGWAAQARAEASHRTGSISVWVILAAMFSVPAVALLLASTVLPVEAMTVTLSYLWNTLTIMTAGSTVVMAVFILRLLRNWRMLTP